VGGGPHRRPAPGPPLDAVHCATVSAPLEAPAPFDPSRFLGAVLDGRYELTGHLATGGMGAVFRARHVHLRKEVAVKVLRPELSSAPDLVERFRREAEIASALAHDNIVKVTDFGRSEDGLLFLAMELLEGDSLFDLLRRERTLAPPRAVGLLWQICAGLEAAHAHGVVHRDLKPENVILSRTPSGREVVKVLDFGIAKFASAGGDGNATSAGIVVGTPEYLSPEQAMGLPVDGRADLYAVGLIAFRMLAGHHPFEPDDARGLLLKQASCPVPPLAEADPALAAWPALCEAVARACEKDPARRPGTAAELGDLFAGALGPAFVAPPGATPVLGPAGAVSPPRAPGGTVPFPGPMIAGAGPPLRARARRRLPLRALGLTALVLALLAAAGLGALAWWERPAELARAALAAGRPAEALAALDPALRRNPGRRDLQLLRGRSLLRLPARRDDAVVAYGAVQERGQLEAEDYRSLAALLGEERSLADRAARVLRDGNDGAVAAVAAAARAGSGTQRLRAMAVLRDLGAEETVDRLGVYGALLADAECDVRRAAARRLGELGDPGAIPALRAAAGATRTERRSAFSAPVRLSACGAPEAGEALRRVQSAN
jgi:eukaryotic-like serine/threonine-protein kinase